MCPDWGGIRNRRFESYRRPKARHVVGVARHRYGLGRERIDVDLVNPFTRRDVGAVLSNLDYDRRVPRGCRFVDGFMRNVSRWRPGAPVR